MNDSRIPCGLEDDRIRFDADEPEADDPRTETEKRLEWICDEWKFAQEEDIYDTWRDVRMMIVGARQALNHCNDRYDDRMDLLDLMGIAFGYSLACILAGRYEGAKNA